jgi:glycosyltransferase involved in cell wall biosynthesis
MKTPRILHLIPALDRSGAAKQLRLLATGLLRSGFDVHVCALGSGGPTADALCTSGIRPKILEKRWTFDLRLLWDLKRLADHLRPDVIHAWGDSANAYGLAAAKSGGVKCLVACFHSTEPAASSLQFHVDRAVGRQSAGLTAGSRGVRDFYVQNGLPEEKFKIIPGAVELPSPPTASRQQILDELELPGNSRLIGLVGRLTLHHRVKDAIWAADLLKVVRKDVHLLIFGDGPHRNRLQMYREQVRIADHVHFLGHRGDLPRFLPHFDLLLSTGDCEGRSNSTLEAMAAGVPVVAADIPGTRDLMAHNETGLLVPVGNRPGFAREAHRILEKPDLAGQLGQAARERVQKEFTVVKLVENYVEMYDRLL